MGSIETGLCHKCFYSKTITSDKGSEFILCDYAKIDNLYEKYPKVPVIECEAFNKNIKI